MDELKGDAGADAEVATIPVNIVTGFLGSGKTTMLRHVLSDPAFSRAAVLINEFGEIGLDHLLVERLDQSTMLMESGCICCTLQDDLRTTLRDLHSRRGRGEVPPFDRIIIETTGLADPAPVMATVMADPMLRHHLRVGNVVTTVDAVNGITSFERFEQSRKQVALADRVLLTKSDLANEDQCADVEARIDELNPHVRIERTVRGAAAADVLTGLGGTNTPERDAELCGWLATAASYRARLRGGGQGDTGVARRAAFQATSVSPSTALHSLVMTLDEPIEWTSFGLWLSLLVQRHGEKILRFKGLLNIAGSETPVMLHGVHALLHPPEHLESWPTEARNCLLVFIIQELAPELVERSLRAFLAAGARISSSEAEYSSSMLNRPALPEAPLLRGWGDDEQDDGQVLA
ncbi:CobW family GTP-binding protein [Ancylobacter sp. G4_0304]|uniref:CobW family GTP-binding protein n=1 Tax=Ancylobacter sp. G4_0304 TaxID=3114289 RepID=UPI0039C62C71